MNNTDNNTAEFDIQIQITYKINKGGRIWYLTILKN
jgi:hypothetical protein